MEIFNEYQITHGMSVGVSKEGEKEQTLAQQEPHVEGTNEQHSSKGYTKLTMEKDTDESINPETDDVNPNPTLPHMTLRHMRNRVTQCGLRSSAPHGGWHQNVQDLCIEKSHQTKQGATQTIVFDLWLCIFLIFRTRDRIFRLPEQRSEEQARKGLE